MTITPEQVADLRPGDVVELRWPNHPDVVVSGPLSLRRGGQWVGPVPVIGPSGQRHGEIDLTVISRAPRPLYVNHPRTEPVPGDVVRGPLGPGTWTFTHDGWVSTRSGKWLLNPPCPASLLVDGETGQVVP